MKSVSIRDPFWTSPDQVLSSTEQHGDTNDILHHYILHHTTVTVVYYITCNVVDT